jgi:hypothetical protein
MLYITFYDVQDLPWRGKNKLPEIQFAPKPERPASFNPRP